MAERIRGRRLQAIRAAYFARAPLCVHCQKAGRVTEATQLDHIVALYNGGKDVSSNRQGLCVDCHKAKTLIDLGMREKKAIGVDGWPE